MRLLLALALVQATAAALAAPPQLRATELAQARDYVLAACVRARYDGTPLAAEAEAWAGGLVERGSLPGAAYPALAQLARSAPPPLQAQDGTAMRLQGCVDFVHDRGFAARVQGVLKGIVRRP